MAGGAAAADHGKDPVGREAEATARDCLRPAERGCPGEEGEVGCVLR